MTSKAIRVERLYPPVIPTGTARARVPDARQLLRYPDPCARLERMERTAEG